MEQEDDIKKHSKRIRRALVVTALATIALGAWGSLALGQPRRAASQLVACKSNLKGIGTALEMHSTDWSGKYPTQLRLITPNYLKTIPECPAAGEVTYRATFGTGAPMNSQSYEDYYYIECYGGHHTDFTAPGNYPAYSGIQAVHERAP